MTFKTNLKMTIGQKRCGIRNREMEPMIVETTRKRIAEIIDGLEQQRGDKNTTPASGEKQRLISLAQTKLEEACMFAVKAMYTE
jgi:hypothetical protein